MAYNPNHHHRHSIRLPGYDYRQPGPYFITICTYGRLRLFGEVIQGVMQVNAYGRIAADEWHRTAMVRPNIVLDAFVVMPNHMHGIIGIVAPDDDGGRGTPANGRGTPANGRGTPAVCPYGRRRFGGAVAGSLPTIMRQYKSIVTKRINRRRGTPGAAVWQRGYYEHIIRNERVLQIIRRYIENNPARWHRDRNAGLWSPINRR